MGLDKFHHLSYEAHEDHYKQYTQGEEKENHARTWLDQNTIDAWRHRRMYQLVDPLFEMYPRSSWVTIGDGRFGNDAHYIKEKGIQVLATDISDYLLKEAKELGYIDSYQKENAEALSFKDNEFDFVFCKESYHHFPRPMLALYEMLRVSKKGVVLLEPNDSFIESTILETTFRYLKDIIKYILRKPSSKNTFEEVGNYCYSISRREIEKLALGINFKNLVFIGINDYYLPHVLEYEVAEYNNKFFKKIKLMISLKDLLCKIKLRQYDLLFCIIFKDKIDQELKMKLLSNHYQVIDLPKNPYLESH